MAKQMTCVFNFNVKKYSGNPHKIDTAFGPPVVVHDGNLIRKHNTLETQNTALAARVADLEGALRNARQYIEYAIYDCKKNNLAHGPAIVAAKKSLAQTDAALAQGENDG